STKYASARADDVLDNTEPAIPNAATTPKSFNRMDRKSAFVACQRRGSVPLFMDYAHPAYGMPSIRYRIQPVNGKRDSHFLDNRSRAVRQSYTTRRRRLSSITRAPCRR